MPLRKFVPPLPQGPKQSFVQHAIDAVWHYPGFQAAVVIAAGVIALVIAAQGVLYARSRTARAG